MSDLIQIEMTLEEARETDRLIKRHINTTRYLLLDMRDRKGWKALGYESFVEYGEKELKLGNFVYRLADAAEIGLQIGVSPIDENQPKETHLRPLKSVPEEERKAIWDEATRKAEEEHAKLTAQRVEDAVREWKQRNDEWVAQSTSQKKHIEALERRIDLFDSEPKPEPVIKVVEKIPADYESIKDKAAKAEQELEKLRNEQTKLVNEQVKTKLQGYQDEVNEMEKKKKSIEDIVARKQAYLDSLSSEVKRIEAHREVINGTRQELIGLAGFLSDIDPMTDTDTVKRWQALAGMLEDACQSIRMVFEPTRPELTVSA